MCRFSQAKIAPVASLLSRKQGLGIPLHIKISFILIQIWHYTLSVLKQILYINHIALAIGPFLGPCVQFKAWRNTSPASADRSPADPKATSNRTTKPYSNHSHTNKETHICHIIRQVYGACIVHIIQNVCNEFNIQCMHWVHCVHCAQHTKYAM